MADDIPQYQFSAAEERLQRESRRAQNQDAIRARSAASPYMQARKAARDRFDTAFGADQAQKAREAAASRLAAGALKPSLAAANASDDDE